MNRAANRLSYEATAAIKTTALIIPDPSDPDYESGLNFMMRIINKFYSNRERMEEIFREIKDFTECGGNLTDEVPEFEELVNKFFRLLYHLKRVYLSSGAEDKETGKILDEWINFMESRNIGVNG